MRTAGLVAALTAMVLATGTGTAAAAQTAYVDDRLQIGVHEQPAVSSTILELLESGAEVEVQERTGDMVRVQTASGVRGWVDARLLSDHPPGRNRAQALETQLAGAQAALADAQAKLVALEQRAVTPVPAAAGSQPIPSDALREMQTLAEENQRLKQQVAEFEAVQRMAQEQAAARAAKTGPTLAAPDPSDDAGEFVPAPGRWANWQVLLVASVLLLAFSAGGWLVDWGIRRRHGGFRI